MIRYTSTVRRATPAREHPCGLCGRPATGWDHCHTHGWIRGPVCHGCNVTIGLEDAYRAGKTRPSGRPHRTSPLARRLAWAGQDEPDTKTQQWIDRCTDCKETQMTDAEQWKQVEGFPYEVSDAGHVRRTEGGSNGTYVGRVLKGYIDKNGYTVVRLSRHGQVYDRKVHRLVCEAFHGPSELPEVRHLDGDPGNNTPGNLSWGTTQQNADDRVAHGRQQQGEDSPRALLTNAQVREIREAYEAARKGRQRVPRGWREATASRYGLTVNGLSTIVSGRGYNTAA